MSKLFSSSVECRTGVLEVTIDTDDFLVFPIPPVGSYTEVEIINSPVIRQGARRTSEYGEYVVASYVSLEFRDPDGLLAAEFTDVFDESDYTVALSLRLEDNRTLSWRGRPRNAVRSRPTSRSNFEPIFRLDVWDRVGKLNTDKGIKTELTNLGNPLAALNLETDWNIPLWVHLDAYPVNAAEKSPTRLRVPEGDSLAGNTLGNYGTKKQQLEALCKMFGLRMFQGIDGSWRAWHVPSIGDEVKNLHEYWFLNFGWIANDYVTVPRNFVTISEDTMGGGRNDIISGVRLLRAINITVQGDRNIIVDGAFEFWIDPASTPSFWTVSNGTNCEQMILTEPVDDIYTSIHWRDELPRALVSTNATAVADQTDLRCKLTFWMKSEFSIDFNEWVEWFLILDDEDGDTWYYHSASGTWSQTISNNIETSVFGFTEKTYTTQQDFPKSGSLRLEFEGLDATLTAVELLLTDPSGTPIAEWNVTFEGSSGHGDTVDLPMALEFDTDPGAQAWAAPSKWESVKYNGRQFPSLVDYQVTDRLAQQFRDALFIDARVRDLVGMETALLFDPDGDGERKFIATALELHLRTGETQLQAMEDLTYTLRRGSGSGGVDPGGGGSGSGSPVGSGSGDPDPDPPSGGEGEDIPKLIPDVI